MTDNHSSNHVLAISVQANVDAYTNNAEMKINQNGEPLPSEVTVEEPS